MHNDIFFMSYYMLWNKWKWKKDIYGCQKQIVTKMYSMSIPELVSEHSEGFIKYQETTHSYNRQIWRI